MNLEVSVPAQKSWILRYCNSRITLTLPKESRTFFFFLFLTAHLGQTKFPETLSSGLHFGSLVQQSKLQTMTRKFCFLHRSCSHPSRPQKCQAIPNYDARSKQVLIEGLRHGLIHTTTHFSFFFFFLKYSEPSLNVISRFLETNFMQNDVYKKKKNNFTIDQLI